MKKKQSVVIGLAVGLSHVAMANAIGFSEALHLTFSQPNVEFNAYSQKWTEENNRGHFDEKYDCYAKEKALVRQVLTINETGFVVDVISESDGPKSECFKAAYLNAKFPNPPAAPYYVYMEIE